MAFEVPSRIPLIPKEARMLLDDEQDATEVQAKSILTKHFLIPKNASKCASRHFLSSNHNVECSSRTQAEK